MIKPEQAKRFFNLYDRTMTSPSNNPQTIRSYFAVRPGALNFALILIALAALAGVTQAFVAAPLSYEWLKAQGGITPPSEKLGAVMQYGALAGGLFKAGIVWLLIFFMARGAGWARLTWLGLLFISGLAAIPALVMDFMVAIWLGVVSIVCMTIFVVGTICLFLPATNRWFRECKAARATTKAV